MKTRNPKVFSSKLHVSASFIVSLCILIAALMGTANTRVPTDDHCIMCVNFAFNYTYDLHQVTNDGDLTCKDSNCDEICKKLLNEAGREVAGKDCGILCNFAGCQKFKNASNTAYKDPFVFCERLTVCREVVNGDAKIQSIVVDPPVVPHGIHFNITVTYHSHNGTGTGEAVLLIFNRDSPYPVWNNTIMEPKPPGTHQIIWKFMSKLDPNCPEKCETWLPGEYDMHISLCNGKCYGDPPLSVRYDYKEQSFQVIPGNCSSCT